MQLKFVALRKKMLKMNFPIKSAIQISIKDVLYLYTYTSLLLIYRTTVLVKKLLVMS